MNIALLPGSGVISEKFAQLEKKLFNLSEQKVKMHNAFFTACTKHIPPCTLPQTENMHIRFAGMPLMISVVL